MSAESDTYGMVPSATEGVRLTLTLQFAPMPPAEPSPLTNLNRIFGPSCQQLAADLPAPQRLSRSMNLAQPFLM